MKVLFLLPDGNYGGAAKQVSLIAPGLPRDRFEARVCVLGRDGPMTADFRSAGLPVETLNWTRLIDPQPPWRLRDLVRTFRPDLLAGWGLAALRWGSLVKGRTRLVISQPLSPHQRPRDFNGVDRWLLRRANRVIAAHEAEAATYRQWGVPAERVRLIPPGVAPVAPRGEPSWPLPAGARLLVCVGPLEAHKGYRDAIWSFDILKYLYDDLHLVIIGDGADRPRLEAFARSLEAHDRTHFPGRQPDAAAWLARAEVVWVLSQTEGGVNVALEAMSLGRPIVACHTPGLAEIVRDEETGFLAPPGDKAALARQTRRLLEDADLRQRLGAAGRQRAEERFSARELVRRWAEMAAETANAL